MTGYSAVLFVVFCSPGTGLTSTLTEVRWPNGLEEEWLDLAVDRIHTLKEGTGRPLGAKG